jgi:hypothetical protein
MRDPDTSANISLTPGSVLHNVTSLQRSTETAGCGESTWDSKYVLARRTCQLNRNGDTRRPAAVDTLVPATADNHLKTVSLTVMAVKFPNFNGMEDGFRQNA